MRASGCNHSIHPFTCSCICAYIQCLLLLVSQTSEQFVGDVLKFNVILACPVGKGILRDVSELVVGSSVISEVLLGPFLAAFLDFLGNIRELMLGVVNELRCLVLHSRINGLGDVADFVYLSRELVDGVLDTLFDGLGEFLCFVGLAGDLLLDGLGCFIHGLDQVIQSGLSLLSHCLDLVLHALVHFSGDVTHLMTAVPGELLDVFHNRLAHILGQLHAKAIPLVVSDQVVDHLLPLFGRGKLEIGDAVLQRGRISDEQALLRLGRRLR
mmetsp:Transcript_20203/g.57352  ORF Transcript_20203/g.57352 Transcript_20203/m.57352 type:complete len:269 (+) Transcript_20203:184-990(+)